MLSANQLRELIEKLGSKELNPGEFLKRFIVASRNMHKCDDPEAVRLCRSIESRLAQIAAGHLDLQNIQESFTPSIIPAVPSIVIERIEHSIFSSMENMCVPFSASGSFSPEFGPKNAAVQAQMISTCS
jgi:hypothetical protein